MIKKSLSLLFVLLIATTFFAFQPAENPKEKWVNSKLNSLSLREKIAQFFMVAGHPNSDEKKLKELRRFVSEDNVGGVIFFQSNKQQLKKEIKDLNALTKIPMLYGIDAEWGVQMRISDSESFPYNYTLGAANDPELTKLNAQMVAQECRKLGIHINFAPVADVNSNPRNPVIGFRSFGEDPKLVARHVAAYVEGLESQGVMSSIKHFPGHGDTELDSHYDLPTLKQTKSQLEAVDFVPFKSGIDAGAGSVMIAHLSVPSLDQNGTPTTLSQPTIQGVLQNELEFKGLIISDALNMKAVSQRYGKTDVVLKAFKAGCDILLFPESVTEAIDAIKNEVETGKISREEINRRCKKVLKAKYDYIIATSTGSAHHSQKKKDFNKYEIQLAKRKVFEKAITVIKNEGELLPIKRFDQRIAVVNIEKNATPFQKSADLVAPVDYFHFLSAEEAVEKGIDTMSNYDMIITVLHTSTVRSASSFGMPKNWERWASDLPNGQNVLVLAGNPLGLQNANLTKFQSVVIGYENTSVALNRLGQFVMGTFASEGKLPMSISPEYPAGFGIEVEWSGRLKDSQPEELGFSREKLTEIDAIAKRGVSSGAYPGCQVVVAVEGKIIYRKSFGHHTYQKKRKVNNFDVYDLASITKVASSTASLMKLNSEGKFGLSNRLGLYLPELTKNTPYANIVLKDMMAHQAGLVAWIPFYKKTLTGNQPSKQWYSSQKSKVYNRKVSDRWWIKSAYTDTIYQRILRTPLKTKRYKYSDLGYYFVKKIVEKQSGKPLDEYVLSSFYAPMGLRTMRYHPLNYFSKNKITPTENDTIFRKELVHGYVHDPGAAQIGGVGGHAGLFSNATDLAGMMQLFLNKGKYGVQIIRPEVIREYTNVQFAPKNRRGAGFDKPVLTGTGGPTCEYVSKKSFGHTGFTGTMAWVDPVYDINYVFLSNRVYPDAENWKLIRMDIRTDIQKVIYEALLD